MASAGSYGLSGRSGPVAYWLKVAGSNCIGPSAPAEFGPLCTPGSGERPWPDSTSPIPASTDQGSPGQVWAASMYQHQPGRRDVRLGQRGRRAGQAGGAAVAAGGAGLAVTSRMISRGNATAAAPAAVTALITAGSVTRTARR